ncbi:uncharacterized protein PHALS_07708 [Plasmopara halstedii]|uniref:Uncharacterized protein n=1 Tax=Plasmopara halstedii TaxID=4781 RepID=A0A0P1B6D7_PLAHL|nr:uncharacterized protein PHALS_07708 [Plasmopara halstedii]CEG49975.1 hypothetical protein PHALS_07708 [Plasmopara halstedii]|eukprot:XP_024586344.1 hypothetical protein PHALS_07708 [Plasmopara halstedii]
MFVCENWCHSCGGQLAYDSKNGIDDISRRPHINESVKECDNAIDIEVDEQVKPTITVKTSTQNGIASYSRLSDRKLSRSRGKDGVHDNNRVVLFGLSRQGRFSQFDRTHLLENSIEDRIMTNMRLQAKETHKKTSANDAKVFVSTDTKSDNLSSRNRKNAKAMVSLEEN